MASLNCVLDFKFLLTAAHLNLANTCVTVTENKPVEQVGALDVRLKFNECRCADTALLEAQNTTRTGTTVSTPW